MRPLKQEWRWLNEAETDAGIRLEEKLNQIFPHFEWMHALYGGRANVAPRVVSNFGADDDEEYLMNVNSDSNDKPVPDGDDDDAGDSLFDTDDQENEAPPSTPTILLAEGRHPLQPLNEPPLVQKKNLTGKTSMKTAQVPEDKQATSKPNMAAIFDEHLNLKAEYRKELIDTKD
ncbi:unnamed protein product [Calypogeia fissa]